MLITSFLMLTQKMLPIKVVIRMFVKVRHCCYTFQINCFIQLELTLANWDKFWIWLKLLISAAACQKMIEKRKVQQIWLETIKKLQKSHSAKNPREGPSGLF